MNRYSYPPNTEAQLAAVRRAVDASAPDRAALRVGIFDRHNTGLGDGKVICAHCQRAFKLWQVDKLPSGELVPSCRKCIRTRQQTIDMFPGMDAKKASPKEDPLIKAAMGRLEAGDLDAVLQTLPATDSTARIKNKRIDFKTFVTQARDLVILRMAKWDDGVLEPTEHGRRWQEIRRRKHKAGDK